MYRKEPAAAKSPSGSTPAEGLVRDFFLKKEKEKKQSQFSILKTVQPWKPNYKTHYRAY